ncbi:hypothetical protein Ade02nite_78740 [Paractinoplanes deccanensis]|uniref:CSD domain-containing protein n=1 Tax=Paractinoplanes deccanensis TaxID=113561 RepID=A0ABQ3YGU0_9ACTN|nr:cold shock domain-containing protein [Actinoplanes deccanensis]GID79233.1 hypothetical protein Ade02nite_78740 [Actinoplanes deccanensis]
MASVGTVREWNADEGWGVIDSADTPGGCWAHFSAGAMGGYVSFGVGERVRFEWEAPGQDGFPYRAVRVWVDGVEPVERGRGERAGGAFTSTLTLTFDEPERSGGS